MEVVWAAVGGAPTEVALDELQQRNEKTVDLIRQSSLLVDSASSIGLVTFGLRELDLSFKPEDLAGRIREAAVSVEICGYTLDYLAGNDLNIEAMSNKARTTIPVRVLLPSATNHTFLLSTGTIFLQRLRCNLNV